MSIQTLICLLGYAIIVLTMSKKYIVPMANFGKLRVSNDPVILAAFLGVAGPLFAYAIWAIDLYLSWITLTLIVISLYKSPSLSLRAFGVYAGFFSCIQAACSMSMKVSVIVAIVLSLVVSLASQLAVRRLEVKAIN